MVCFHARSILGVAPPRGFASSRLSGRSLVSAPIAAARSGCAAFSTHHKAYVEGWSTKTLMQQREPLLFTPGPLTTSAGVKQAMLVDIGSRDSRMVTVIQEIRDLLLEMAGVSQAAGWECVLVQGSGTMVVESVVNTVIPGKAAGGRLLVVSNGAYGLRMAKMAEMYGIEVDVIQYDETDRAVASDVVEALNKQRWIKFQRYTHVGCIHHETTAGTLNPIEEIGAAIFLSIVLYGYFVLFIVSLLLYMFHMFQ